MEKSQDTGSKFIKEFIKVSNSKYDLLTVVGRERTDKIMEDYKNYVIKNNTSKKKAWNDSKSYNKDFLNYIKKEVVKPEMVDDPELMDLMVMEYEDSTGKKAMKD